MGTGPLYVRFFFSMRNHRHIQTKPNQTMYSIRHFLFNCTPQPNHLTSYLTKVWGVILLFKLTEVLEQFQIPFEARFIENFYPRIERFREIFLKMLLMDRFLVQICWFSKSLCLEVFKHFKQERHLKFYPNPRIQV